MPDQRHLLSIRQTFVTQSSSFVQEFPDPDLNPSILVATPAIRKIMNNAIKRRELIQSINFLEKSLPKNCYRCAAVLLLRVPLRAPPFAPPNEKYS